MKYTFRKGGIITCEYENCGSCRVKEHSCHDCMPGDTLVGENGLPFCIGCCQPAQTITETAHLMLFGIHEECRGKKVASIAARFGMIDGDHHKQWVIDQMLRAALCKHKYEEWVEQMNSDPDYEPWDVGTPP